jgi:sulfate adenylyltransferase
MFAPSPEALAHLELLLTGAYAPVSGFMDRAEVKSVSTSGMLPEGALWPVPITLEVPAELAESDVLALTDPEGTPLALLSVTEAWQMGPRWYLAGRLESLREPAHGAFRRLRRPPAEVRAELAGDRPVLTVIARRPLHRRALGQIRQAADRLDARVLVMAGDDAVRTIVAARKDLPADTVIIALPLPASSDPERDVTVQTHVAAAHGATHLLADLAPGSDAVLPVIVPEPWAYDTDVEVWRPLAKIEPEYVREELAQSELSDILDSGAPIPEWFTPPAIADEMRRAHPPRYERGVTVFFTGLSGSGKSTVARGLADALAERGDRTVTLLDGDVVRRMLSAGLTFSRADRDANIRRIGFVAAEITRHGGMAICAPIAPYAETRDEVRAMVEATGDFLLIHVATPLEECERRDRKGLYAKARAGLISEFTGISDPYEEPFDANLVLDTTDMTIDDAVNAVLSLLTTGGWLRP